MMRLKALSICAALALAACETGTGSPPSPASRAPATTPVVDTVRFPAELQPRGVSRSNITLAQDFLDLTFALESGQHLPGLLRYEGPVRISMTGAALAPYQQDLENLLTRLRIEAGVDIRFVSDPATAHIHIDGVSAKDIQRVYPGAACFIVPGETSWRGFRAKSARSRIRWSDQTTLGTTGIFVPTDSSPQDIRDCLHEEIGQALGPANDVYRLSDSVFNDDNFHSILTSFDMLMLRVLYNPELRSGMPRAAVQHRVVDILNRINPQGRGIGAQQRAPESATWKKQIETAMTRKNSRGTRLRAVDHAVNLANSMAPPDHRLSVALMTRGRLTMRDNPTAAAKDFSSAYQLLRGRLGENDLRTSQSTLHLAIFALRGGDYATAISLADKGIPVARKGQNAVLLSGFYAIQSEAYLRSGNNNRAQSTRVKSLKWARYAFGDVNGAIARTQAELEALGPLDLPPVRSAEN